MKRPAKIAATMALLVAAAFAAFVALAPAKRDTSPYAASDDLDVSDDFTDPMPPIVAGYRVKQPDGSARWIDVRFDGDDALQASRDQWSAVHVWATWCAPCVRELPELNHALPEINANGLRFFVVNVDHTGTDTPESIRSLFETKGYANLPPLVVNKDDIADVRAALGFKNSAAPYPITMIYGPGGVPVAYVTGAGGENPQPFWRSTEFHTWLDKVKAEYKG